jgi:hypothetical protein
MWQVFRSVYQMTKPPLLLGGVALGCGYAWSLLKKVKSPLPPELTGFVREEQMRRLRKLVGIKSWTKEQQPSQGTAFGGGQ